MTRIVCIGDCHFGVRGGRNADRYAAFDQILDYGRTLDGLGAWLLAGDLNDAKMTIEDRNQIAPRLQAMGELAPVLGVRGNHDQDGDLAIWSRLDSPHPIWFDERPIVRTLSLATGETAAVFCLPYAFKSGLVSAGVQHDQHGQTAREYFDPIFIEAAADLERAIAGGLPALMLAHVNIGGAVTSAGQPSVGLEIELDHGLLARLPNVPKIFGHIHKHQQIHGAWYLGSIARQDFGESEDKVFGVLEFDGAAWSLRFERINTPRQFTVTGRLTREAFTITALDGDPWVGPPAFGWAGADVKAAYTYRKSEIGTLDVAKIHAEFAEARSLKLDPVPEIDHEVRAPEIAAAATLEAKVGAFCALNKIPVTALVRDALAALQARDRESVLADVRAFASAAGASQATPASSEMSEVA